MKVLSLFDGISVGRVALQRAGIPVDAYLASEIDKPAIFVAQKNFPDNIQLGSVAAVKLIDLPPIDILLGGSPCQGFSNAGKGLNFDDPRSKLLFDYVRILKTLKPKYFLLENVSMRQGWEDVITDLLGVTPIKINSKLVSAQNRKRVYWTNIPGVTQPIDREIMLIDILENSACPRGLHIRQKSKCVRVGGKNSPAGSKQEWDLPFTYVVPRGNNKGGFKEYTGKSPTVTSSSWQNNIKLFQSGNLRRYTVKECERLQTLPDDYTAGVSNTQRYRMLGNGWTVDVIAHILSFIPGATSQPSLHQQHKR